MVSDSIMSTTAIALNANESVAVIAIARTLKKLPPERGQQFLTSVWVDLRRDAPDGRKVRKGLLTFFDLYFALHGDFAKIDRTMLSAIPDRFQAEVSRDVDEMVAKNLQMSEELGDRPIAEAVVLGMPAAIVSQPTDPQ